MVHSRYILQNSVKNAIAVGEFDHFSLEHCLGRYIKESCSYNNPQLPIKGPHSRLPTAGTHVCKCRDTLKATADVENLYVSCTDESCKEMKQTTGSGIW